MKGQYIKFLSNTGSEKKQKNEDNWWSNICCDAKDQLVIKCEIWSIFTIILIAVSIISIIITLDNCEDDVVTLWKHNPEECSGPDEPILLSRALTTLDWARAFAIGFAVISTAFIFITPMHKGIKHKIFIKIPLIIALFIFSDAFVVNMFQDNVHVYLIGLGAAIAIIFTIPGIKSCKPLNNCYREDRDIWPCGRLRPIWWILWVTMVVAGGIFIGFWIVEENNDGIPLKSWWYVSEYIFFWTMYFLVGFALGAEEASNN